MIITITGPGGCGKTTLVRGIIRRLNGRGVELVSCTSRNPRPMEREGIDYYFVSRSDFEDTDSFLEIVEFNNNLYGLKKQEITDKFLSYPLCFVIVNQEGAKTISKFCKESFGEFGARSVYVSVSKERALKQLKQRDGKKKALNRFNYDIEIGMFNPSGYDCVISNYGSKKELVDNLHNYLLAMREEQRLRAGENK